MAVPTLGFQRDGELAAQSGRRYRLLRPLASGGMGQVLLAQTIGLNGFSKLVAIKQMLPVYAKDEQVVDRFIDEALVASIIDHPNVVQVYDFGIEDGAYFIAMEYVHGVSVHSLAAQLARSHRAIPLSVTLGVVIAACEALHFAHETRDATGRPLGIVHRDISPGNLLLSTTGEVKVTDFGVARFANRRSVTSAGVVVGKTAYMAPEQLSGERVDRRADVFGLGVTMHEMLSGQRLFAGAPAVAELRPRPNPPSAIRSELPRDLDRIVLRALAERVEDRYPTCELMGAELEAVAARHRLHLNARDRAEVLLRYFPDLRRSPDLGPSMPPRPARIAAPPPSTPPPRRPPRFDLHRAATKKLLRLDFPSLSRMLTQRPLWSPPPAWRRDALPVPARLSPPRRVPPPLFVARTRRRRPALTQVQLVIGALALFTLSLTLTLAVP